METRRRPVDLDEVLRRVRETVRPFPRAAMFELAERGHAGLFAQVVACILSIRTRDEVSLPAALALFARAASPAALVQLGPEGIDSLIRTVSFHEAKARQLHAIARRTLEEFGGELPCDAGVPVSFPGVGPKCAHLALGIACGQARISVDVHVHRVTNRWGLVRAPAPQATMRALEGVLPERYRIELNALLVPFGKHVCTGVRPRCSTCPVREFCRQVGVTERR